MIFTLSELKAQSMLLNLRGYFTNQNMNDDPYNNPNYCGNEIIKLAEQIKAERSIIAMEK
jgi:hypothetical protein